MSQKRFDFLSYGIIHQNELSVSLRLAKSSTSAKSKAKRPGNHLKGLTQRQVTRLKKKIIQNGDQSIVHGMLGKGSNNKTPEVEKEKILSLYKLKYEPCGFNFTHLSEKLLELENIHISRETLRSWIRQSIFIEL